MRSRETIRKHLFWISVLLPSVLGCLSCGSQKDVDTKKALKEIKPMSEPVLVNYGDYEVMMPPSVYSVGDYIRYVFAVPKDNTVGTNELDNAITLLRFKSDDEIEKETVKKDFMEMVTGPFEFRFLPVWSEKEIAYSQSRGFLLIDLLKKKVGIHTVLPGLDDIIGNLSVLNGQNRTFVFEINAQAAGLGNYDKLLRVVRFVDDTFTVLGEKPAGRKTSAYSEPWFVYENRIFIYNDTTTTLEVYDELFKPVSHPLSEAFNKNKAAFRCMEAIAVHPTLPLGLIMEMGKLPTKEKLEAVDRLPDSQCEKARETIYDEVSRKTLYLFRWTHSDPKQRFVPLLSVAGSIWGSYNPANNYSDFTFSPDGKWVVFRDCTGHANNPVFVAVPIDSKNPLYFGKPIKLGNAMRKGATGPTGTAWTTNPTAFVMCGGLAIYRWNLDAVSGMRRENAAPGTKPPF